MKFEIRIANTLKKAKKMLDENDIDLILLDPGLPDSSSLDTVANVIAHAPLVPIIVLTVLSDNKRAEEAINRGAQDYLVKDMINTDSLVRSIRYSVNRNRARAELERSEKKYHSLWNNSTNGLAYHELVTDDNGRPIDSIFLEVNLSFENITGLKRKDVVGKRLSKVKPKFFSNNLDPSTTFWKVALSGESMSFEIQIPETKRWFSLSVYSPSHRTFVSVLQDITQRKLIEDNRQQNENRLKHAQHIAKMGFLTWDLKTNEIIWSDEIFRIYGVDKEKVQPTIDYTLSLVHADDLAFVKENVDAAVKSKKVYNIDHRVVQPNGKIIWVHAQGEVVYDSAATPIVLLETVIDITKRKLEKIEIIENKEKFRSIFEDSAMANNLFDSSGVMIELNQACVDLFGVRSKEDLHGFRLFEDPNFPDEVKKRVLSGETVRYVSEFSFDKVKKHALYNTSKSGIIYLDTLVAPFGKTDQGSVAGYFVQMIDITERVRINELLRESEEKYHGIFDHSAFGIVLASRNDKVIDVNPEMEALLGYTHEEFCKMKIADFSHPEDDAIDKEFAQQLMKGEMETFRMEKRYIKKNGDTIWTNLTVSAIPDKNGQIDFFIGIVEDISEKKLAIAALKSSEERFRMFFMRAPVYCYLVSPEGILIDVNEAALNVLGYTKGELVGKPLKIVYAPTNYAKVDSLFAKWKVSGHLQNESVDIITKTGECRSVLLSVDAVRDQDGNILHSISVQIEVTH